MSLMKSVATFGGFTLISRVTGFIRDMVLANFLGAGSIAEGHSYSMHNPRMVVDERALPLGAALYAHCATRYLQSRV